MKINLYNLTLNKTLSEVKRLSTEYINDLKDFKNWTLEKIFYYVSNNIQYIKDPYGIELVMRPGITIQRGGGDCDDKTVLILAFLKMQNIKCGFSIVGQDAQYHHIFPFAVTTEGKIFDLDATYPGAVYGSVKRWNVRKNYYL